MIKCLFLAFHWLQNHTQIFRLKVHVFVVFPKKKTSLSNSNIYTYNNELGELIFKDSPVGM